MINCDGITERIIDAVKGKSLIDIARACGASKSTPGKWEKGSMPRADYVVGMCKYLDVSPNWLLLGRGPRKLSECNFDVKVTSGKVAGRIGPDAAKERVLAWVSEQPDEAIGWGGVEHAMMASLKDYEEWLKKRAEHGERGTITESKSAV